MSKENWIMGVIAMILFIFIAIGFNAKRVEEKKNYSNNWKFGDWETRKENSIVQPIPNNPQPPQPPPQPPQPFEKQQITAKSYDEALKVAKEKNMNIVIFFYGHSCGWCDKIKTVLKDENVQKELRKYIYLEIDASKDSSLREKYKIKGVPQLTIISYDEKVEKSKTGYMSEKALTNWLK